MRSLRNAVEFLGMVTLTLCITTQLRAEETTSSGTITQCSKLIKECFAQDPSKRNECFFASYKHPFCEGSSLGKLSYKRWAMTPSRSGNVNQPPGFLGPQIVNHNCISKFDTKWSIHLLGDKISEEDVARFSNILDQCKRDITDEIVRP